jgi:hypothetical protein
MRGWGGKTVIGRMRTAGRNPGLSSRIRGAASGLRGHLQAGRPDAEAVGEQRGTQESIVGGVGQGGLVLDDVIGEASGGPQPYVAPGRPAHDDYLDAGAEARGAVR